MRVEFQGTPKEVAKQMQEFLAELNLEPTNEKEIPKFIELTGNVGNKATVKDLKNAFVKHKLSWLDFKRNNDLNLRRNNRGWYVVGIKILDN